MRGNDTATASLIDSELPFLHAMFGTLVECLTATCFIDPHHSGSLPLTLTSRLCQSPQRKESPACRSVLVRPFMSCGGAGTCRILIHKDRAVYLVSLEFSVSVIHSLCDTSLCRIWLNSLTRTSKFWLKWPG